ncbi:Endonuclease/exonuclease/phosphatase [Quillaja saponaria]|uniref:Endonuclease/exonuclease/phosphatase n=1 Tax=Quillaja saponaria TaxID=32244 RepID=A0AAD7LGY4_QUISA|nr:Endonuclease/exonuclease/phosphatase [Quillaja saponaria]
MWQLEDKMECIGMGYDFFLNRFYKLEDMQKVLKEGPRFINAHFMTIRAWTPNFKASTATFSSVATWIRLPELPIECYDILKEIVGDIGVVLRIDENIAESLRGLFARLYI